MAEMRQWLPLESNPEVMNKFLKQLGVPGEFGLMDIVDVDDEHLHEISNVKAILMLFPTGDPHEDHCRDEQEMIENEGQIVSDRVYFVRLDQNNASGTISLIHVVANSDEDIQLSEDSSLKDFIERTREMSPEERGQELEMDEAIGSVHESLAQEGQTEAPRAEEEVNLHFIAFVNVDEQLYELDAHKNYPINHGSTSNDTLLRDAVGVCKQFMERDSENVNFSLMAFIELPPSTDEEDAGGAGIVVVEEAAEDEEAEEGGGGGDEEPAEEDAAEAEEVAEETVDDE